MTKINTSMPPNPYPNILISFASTF